jgi:Ulp1 family protease
MIQFPNIFALSSFTVASNKLPTFLNDIKSVDNYKLIVPINAKAHWFLLYLTPKEAIVFDSMNTKNVLKKTETKMYNLIAELQGNHDTHIQWNFFGHQTDGVSCGVYTCLYALCIALDIQPVEIHRFESDIAHFKELILKDVLQKDMKHSSFIDRVTFLKNDWVHKSNALDKPPQLKRQRVTKLPSALRSPYVTK